MAKREITILTGGAGFIGSCFLWKLNQQGVSDIIVVDNLDSGDKWKNLSGKKFIDYIQKNDFLDILESGKLPEIKTVVHMGACSSTILNDASYFLKNNYEYSKRLALWAFSHKAKFIYASSAATYGDGCLGYDDAEKSLSGLQPLNIYGYTKHLFDLWLLRNDLLKKAVGLKFFNVFGPNEYHKKEMMSVICKRFDELKEGKSMRLFKSYCEGYKDGEQKRDFIYVKDAVEVMYYFYKNLDKTGIYNLGTGKARSWNDVALSMFSSLGKSPKIEYIEMPPEIKGQYQYYTQAKMDKLSACGCKHKFTSLEEAIKDYTSYLDKKTYL
ncbi:MAG: ADP-glyceromanno-heptose 6-epimerase [Candidatus Omnitrophica bacterium]|jgi:ADP-L-glycero-D-manno-heptose 6-epimerase|nr:ADP-glyceromanno-heptose 6-epimerase [Candidatus Omnitrophota bacterium]